MKADGINDLAAQVAQLPPERQNEVFDFVQFLLEREDKGKTPLAEITQLSEGSLKNIWDNSDDAAYDEL